MSQPVQPAVYDTLSYGEPLTLASSRNQQNGEKNLDQDDAGSDSKIAEDSHPAKTPVAQDDGVTRVEALYVVFGKGWGLYSLWISIGLIAYVYALSRSTTFACRSEPFTQAR